MKRVESLTNLRGITRTLRISVMGVCLFFRLAHGFANGGVPLEIKLIAGESVSTTRFPPTIEVIFKNNSDRPLIIIEPQDGSYHGWLPPHYDFKVVNIATGVVIKPGARCGNFGGTYTDKTMHRIEPQQIKSFTLNPHWIGEAGKYSFQFTYRVPPKTYPGQQHDGRVTGLINTGKDWPDSVFVGEAKSNIVEIRVWPLDDEQAQRSATVLLSPKSTEAEMYCHLAVLETLGPRALPALPSVTQILKRKDKMLWNAIQVIKAIGPSAGEATPELISLLPREGAIEALGRIGPGAESSVPHLIKILESDHPWSRQAADVALAGC